jgi:hypothetical protein
MNKIAELSKDLKKEYKPKKRNFKNPVKCWSEKDIINKRIVDTFVIIFNTRGCSWALKSGCSMCGYFNDSSFENISDKDLLSQYEKAMERYNNESFVKIFNSGSFLDESEISEKVRNKILIDLNRKTKKFSFESRPEYITKKTINAVKKIYEKKIEIGIGLETADDYIRKNMINKGFTYKTYKKSVDILQKNDIDVKTYVLIKPPFLTEKESINDAINTVKKIKDISNVISFNPCNVQRNTIVEFLWKKNKYRPPWLFSVVEILKESKKIVGNNARLKCDVAGGGNIRGAHNCKICDKNYLKAIANFSLNQNINVFKNLTCECKEKWLDQIDIENLGFGSLVDMYG